MLDLMREYVFGFVNRQDFEVPRAIMSEDYTLHVGTETLSGRDERYLPAVAQQFANYPTLTYSVHELVTDGTLTGVLFTEHGRSVREPAREAAWIGVGIYRCEDSRLAECWVEQDHDGKRRQLRSGVADAVRPVALDPWAGHGAASPADTDRAAPIVRSWLASLDSWPPPGAELDGDTGEPVRLRVAGTELEVVVAEGSRVAFHAVVRGAYQGGIADTDADLGREVRVRVGAVAELDGDTVTRLRGATNRIAVARQLREAADQGGAA